MTVLQFERAPAPEALRSFTIPPIVLLDLVVELMREKYGDTATAQMLMTSINEVVDECSETPLTRQRSP